MGRCSEGAKGQGEKDVVCVNAVAAARLGWVEVLISLVFLNTSVLHLHYFKKLFFFRFTLVFF